MREVTSRFEFLHWLPIRAVAPDVADLRLPRGAGVHQAKCENRGYQDADEKR